MALVTKTFSDIITFTRTGTSATYFNSAGVLTTAGADVPRFDYNPATLAARGLLIEEARTNRIANTVASASMSIGTGSAIGPNGQPMNTAIIGSGAMSFPQLGVGSGNAQSFTLTAGQSIDVALSGWFAAGTAGMIIEPRLIADFRTAPSANFTYAELQINTSTWAVRSKSLGVDITEVSAPSITLFSTGVYRVTWVVRYTQGATIRDTSGVYVQLRDSTGSGTFTGDGVGNFQYFGLQGETGSFPTSVIPTTTTALTRSADVASVNTLAPWYNATAGTLFAESVSSVPSATLSGSIQPNIIYVTDGTSANRIGMFYNTGNVISGRIVTAGAGSNPSDISANLPSVNRSALAYAIGTNQGAFSVNASAVTTSSPANLPVVDRMSLGAGPVGIALNGYLRRITYYPRRLSNVELQALTV